MSSTEALVRAPDDDPDLDPRLAEALGARASESAALLATAREAAIMRMTSILHQPDSLQTLGDLRKDILASVAVMDAQLRAVMATQMQDIATAVELVSDSRPEAASMIQVMGSVGEQASASETVIPRFELIARLDVTRRNVEQTRRLLRQINALPEKVAELRDALMTDDSRLLWVHSQLRRLERSRLLMPEDPVLAERFREVEELRSEVEARVRVIVGSAREVVASDPTMLVMALRIVEREEKSVRRRLAADERAASGLVRTGSPSRRAKPKLVECFGAARVLCGPYGQMASAAIEQSVEERFMAVLGLSADDPTVGILTMLEQAEFILDDLELCLDEVVPCFPARYQIFTFLGACYHRHLYEVLRAKANSTELAPMEILEMRRYCVEHEQTMANRVGLTGLEPPLVDAFEDLMGRFTVQIRSLCSTFADGIARTDLTERSETPFFDPNGLRCTGAPVSLFQMANEFVEPTEATSRGRLLRDVAFECCAAMQRYQSLVNDILDELRAETSRSGIAPVGLPGSYAFAEAKLRPPRAAPKPRGVFASLWSAAPAAAAEPTPEDDAAAEDLAIKKEQVFFYVVEQLNNSAICCLEHVQAFRESVLEILDPEFADETDMFDDAEGAFFAGATLATETLADLILVELVPVFDLLFTKEAENPFGSGIGAMIDHLDMYFAPVDSNGLGLCECVHESFFEKLVVACATRVAESYLRRLLAMNPKTPWELEPAMQLQDDVNVFREFVCEMAPQSEAKVDAALSAMHKVADFLAGGRNIGLWFDGLVRAHPDIDAAQLEQLVKMRAREDPKDKSKESEQVVQLTRELTFPVGDLAPPGVFTRLRKSAAKK